MMTRLLTLSLLLLTSQASALSCYMPSPDERAAEMRALKLSSSETETLVDGTFTFVRILDRTIERGDETVTALWTFEGERFVGGKAQTVSLPVEVKFWCWQHRCDRGRVRAAETLGLMRLKRESAEGPWMLYLGDCTADVFSYHEDKI